MILMGIVTGVIVAFPVGPMGIFCLHRTIEFGKWIGLAAVLGAALSDFIYAYSGSIIATLTSKYWTMHGVHYVVGVMIILIGASIFISRGKANSRYDSVGFVATLSTAFALTIANPVSGILFISFFALYRISSASLPFALGVFGGSVLWWFAFLWVGSVIKGRVKILRSLLFVIFLLYGLAFIFKETSLPSL